RLVRRAQRPGVRLRRVQPRPAAPPQAARLVRGPRGPRVPLRAPRGRPAEAGAARASPEALERARRALALMPRTQNTRTCKSYLRRIQFASEEAVARAGVEVTEVLEAPLTESVSANGEVGYDQTRLARLASRVRGTVWRVDKVVGQPVRKGDVLALVDAAEV